MFTKILIANRGEIACRIIKTARHLNIETVAVYSTADKDARHVALADQAFCIGDAMASASYLNIDAIISVARAAKVQAIHPGYGFLSENSNFAQACADANIVFIGPSIEALEIMGSKQLAKQLLETSNVPLTPGYHGLDQSDETLFAEAIKLGFPVLLKAAHGGGGKGMRAVSNASEWVGALNGARREATASFGNDTMLIEKLIQTPRHIEIQIMADNHGAIVHLFERDCSIQRRHQKIIEEAPAVFLPDTLRASLAKAAIAVAKAINYRGAGTIEFLVENNTNFYFMEMNTRLQVEHPVTELITGLDLVEWQLRIAANETLPCAQSEIKAHGHAIECRIYAEDPSNHFLPSIGQLHFLQEPAGDYIRIDSGVECHSFISKYYDPMISKLITWGETRACAQQRMMQALKHYYIGGVKTNIPFLQAIIQHPKFINADLSTHFLTQESIEIAVVSPILAVQMAACVDYLKAICADDPLITATFAWQMHLHSHWYARFIVNGEPHHVRITPIDFETLAIELNHHTTQWNVKITSTVANTAKQPHLKYETGLLRYTSSDKTEPRLLGSGSIHEYITCVPYEIMPNNVIFYTKQGPICVERFQSSLVSNDNALKNNQLTAPMPATIVAVLKSKGDSIKAGECIMVLEAMKMEHTIHAPADGILTDIFYDIGAQVNEGAELAALEMSPT
jgi:3-methylcrotonyl-CoA carboxylase alpha subunit